MHENFGWPVTKSHNCKPAGRKNARITPSTSRAQNRAFFVRTSRDDETTMLLKTACGDARESGLHPSHPATSQKL